MPRLVYRGLFAIAIKMSNKVLLTVNGLCGNHLLNAHDEGFKGGLDVHVCMYILIAIVDNQLFHTTLFENPFWPLNSS